MRFIRFSILLLAITALHGDGSSSKARLFVHVQGLRNAEGIAGALLFQSARGFPDTKVQAFRMSGAHIRGNAATIVFTDLPSGQYALSVIHDENENRAMDKNLLRLPAEGFGFSNNPDTGLRLPAFSESSFDFTGDKDQHIYIKIRYL